MEQAAPPDPGTQKSINELEALIPNSEPGADVLTYPGIRTPLYNDMGELVIGAINEELGAAELKEAGLWHTLESSQGLEAEAAAHELARINMVKSAREIHKQGTDSTLWSERFTEASIELYGQPNPQEAAWQLSGVADGLRQHNFKDPELQAMQEDVLSRYETVVEASAIDTSQERADTLATIIEDAKEFGGLMLREYPDVFALVTDDERVYSPEEQLELVTQALEVLGTHHPMWEKVKPKYVENKAHLSVSSRDPENIYISIGGKRANSTGREMKGLLAHELIWHLGRGLNGWEKSDQLLASGLPTYEAFEEGGGLYAEVGITGVLKTNHIDRYVDIALALGNIDGEAVSRKELLDLAYKRNVLRAAMKNNGTVTDADKETAKAAAKGHVDRIFKGGIGDESEAGRAGVFTKDVIYFDGLVQYHQRDVERRQSGVSIAAMYEFDRQGKTVATNPNHVAYAESKGIPFAA